MKELILKLLLQKNININSKNVDDLYQAGINNIMINIEYYYDKPYSCESVFKELFKRGVLKKINEIN